ncbi:hypothetical protein Tco_1458717 [Tanacetum coccineum]
MEFESAQSNTTAKLPILKLENGNAWVSVPQTAQENGTSVTKIQYTDAKTMFASIETQFGGIEETVGASSGASKLGLYDYALSTSSTNHVNTAMPAYEVSTASPDNPNGSNLLHQDLEQIHEDDRKQENFINAMITCWGVIRAPRSKEGQFRNQDNTRKQGNNEDTSSKHVGYRWDSELEEQLITYRKNEVLFSKDVAVFKREVACKDYEINVLKSEFEKVKQEKEGHGSEDSKKESNVVYDKKSDDSKENYDKSLVKEQVSKDTSSFVESSLNVDKETVFLVIKGGSKELEWAEVQSTRKVTILSTKRTSPNAQRNMVPRAVLMKTGLKTFNTARTVNTAHPKSTVAQAVNTARPQAVNTARPKIVKTARPNSAVVNAVRNRIQRESNLIASARIVLLVRSDSFVFLGVFHWHMELSHCLSVLLFSPAVLSCSITTPFLACTSFFVNCLLTLKRQPLRRVLAASECLGLFYLVVPSPEACALLIEGSSSSESVKTKFLLFRNPSNFFTFLTSFHYCILPMVSIGFKSSSRHGLEVACAGDGMEKVMVDRRLLLIDVAHLLEVQS